MLPDFPNFCTLPNRLQIVKLLKKKRKINVLELFDCLKVTVDIFSRPSSKEEHTSDAVSNCNTNTLISNDDSVADPDFQMEVNTSHNSKQENVHTTPNEYQEMPYQMPENTNGILVPITTQ